MTYRVNVQLKAGPSPTTQVVDAALPRQGQTIVVEMRGCQISARVVAIWTPSSKTRTDGLIVVEAQEI